jgi:hypothetical protein
MDDKVQILSIVAAAGLLFVVLELVRRRRLLERYALVWLFSCVVLLTLAIWRGGLAKLAHVMGIASGPNALFFIAFVFVLVLLLHFSAAVSRLADQSKVLAQRLALLEERLRRHDEAADGPHDAPHDRAPAVYEAEVVEPLEVERATTRR